MMSHLTGRVAVVTGGSSGIGEATVRRMLAHGAKVVSADLNAAPDDIYSVDFRHISVDLAEPESAHRIAATAIDSFGQLDILINNVGIAPTRESFSSTADQDWEVTWNVNVMAAVRLTRVALPHLQQSSHAAIVFVASTTGRTPSPYFVDYAVTKAGLITLTKALSEEVGPANIRVNSVSPGSIRTPLWDSPGGFVDHLASTFGLDREQAVDKYVREDRRIPLGRPGTADDVAKVIVFLASDDAGYVTGVDIAIDGGFTRTI